MLIFFPIFFEPDFQTWLSTPWIFFCEELSDGSPGFRKARFEEVHRVCGSFCPRWGRNSFKKYRVRTLLSDNFRSYFKGFTTRNYIHVRVVCGSQRRSTLPVCL